MPSYMEKYWSLFPGLKDKLFSQLRDGYYRLNIPKEDIRNVVYNDPAFSAYAERIDNAFDAWMQMVDSSLRSNGVQGATSGIKKQVV